MNLYDLIPRRLLDDALEQGLVRRQTHPELPLAILNYTERAAYDGLWNEATLTCRGLIYDVETTAIVARPFPKFFNYGQPGAPELDLDAPAASPAYLGSRTATETTMAAPEYPPITWPDLLALLHADLACDEPFDEWVRRQNFEAEALVVLAEFLTATWIDSGEKLETLALMAFTAGWNAHHSLRGERS